MISPVTRGVHHLGLTVDDLSAARAFLLEALHFRLLGEDPDYPAAFLSDDVTVITLWQAKAGAAAFDRQRQVGLHHVAFSLNSVSALVALHEKLADWPGVAVECEITAPSAGSTARHFLIRMPGGPRIEFYVGRESQ